MGDDNFSISEEMKKAKTQQLSRLKAQLFEQKTKSFDDNHDFTMSHFLVRPGGSIAVMGAGDGRVCAEYARLKPHLQIIGLENNPHNISKAQKRFKISNLSMIQGDMEMIPFADNTLHGLLHAGTLHRLYSRTGYNITSVMNALRTQMAALKLGGLLVIRDYILPTGNKFILMEFPDTKSYGKDIHDLSDADLLLRFSQTARPLDTNGCEGFFIEELESKTDGTRLFRLPYKWAVEFIYRMDKRDDWDAELLQEYTFLTPHELSKQLDLLGVRTIYTGPYWDEDTITNNYQDRFKLYSEDGQTIEYPPTTFVTVAQKIGINEPVIIQERRPLSADDKDTQLTIKAVKDDDNHVYEFAELKNNTNDILPYRITDDGRLFILLRSGVPRPAVGAAPRGTPNLDGKTWSGFMFEPIVIPAGLGDERDDVIRETLYDLIRIPFEDQGQSEFITSYFPDAEKISSRVDAYSIEVKLPRDALKRAQANEAQHHPFNPGFVREFDAQDVLKAIHVGLVPDTRLEIALTVLMENLGITPENLIAEHIKPGISSPKKILTPDEVEELSRKGNIFTVTDERPGSIKHVHSIFVEETRIDGLATGVATHHHDMILPIHTSTNTVVVLPLTVDSASGEMMVGLEQRKAPAANRVGGQETQLNLPTFRLPEDIRTISQAKEFVAVQIGCRPEDLRQMGSSYFIHSETGPERIFPMSVCNPGDIDFNNMDFIHYQYLNFLMQPIAEGPLRDKSTMGLMLKGKKWLQQMHGYGYSNTDVLNETQKRQLRENLFQPPPLKPE